MKKITCATLRGLALASVLAVRASAVWVPSTSLEEKRPRPSQAQLQGAAMMLREDDRKLEKAFAELKKDQADLRRLLDVKEEPGERSLNQ